MSGTVLICDDSIAVHRSLKSYLKNENIEVISAFTGEDAVNTVKSMKVDLVILDVMLPGMSGLDVCRAIRAYDRSIYIMMLSAKGEVVDRVIGLELGCDDYITKPFSPREVSVKVRNVLSRMSMKKISEDQIISFEGLTINSASYQAFYGSRKIDLTNKELGVLMLLIRKAGTAVSRDTIIETVWDYDYDGNIRTVDSLMKRLKQKLNEAGVHLNFKSIYGVGFRLDHSDEK